VPLQYVRFAILSAIVVRQAARAEATFPKIPRPGRILALAPDDPVLRPGGTACQPNWPGWGKSVIIGLIAGEL